MALTHGNRQLKPWRYLLAGMLLLLAQLATVVHASEHEFHEHSNFCDVFQRAEYQQGDGQISADVTTPIYGQHIFQPRVLLGCPLSREFRYFHQRAPPHF